MERLFQTIREQTPPALWSVSVETARTATIIELPSPERDERLFRITVGRGAACTVSLSEETEVWQCDCADDADPCRHVVAVVIAERQGRISKEQALRKNEVTGHIAYSFSRREGALFFDRVVVRGEDRVSLEGSLSAFLASDSPLSRGVTFTREDQQIDHVLPTRKSGIFDPHTMGLLLKALSRCSCIELDGVPIRVAGAACEMPLEVVDREDEIVIRGAKVDGVSEVFVNGAVVIDGALAATTDSRLSAEEIIRYAGAGRAFPMSFASELASVVVPALQERVSVIVRSRRLPRAVRSRPRIVVEALSTNDGAGLTVIPRIVYGDPIVGEVVGDGVRPLVRDLVVVRDRVEESRLRRELSTKLSLHPNQARALSGEGIVHFSRQVREWEVTGSGTALTATPIPLSLRITESSGAVALVFEGEASGSVSADEVARAYRRGESFIRLSDGRWGALPTWWLAEHQAILERVLAAKEQGVTKDPRIVSDVEDLCESVGVECPPYLARIREKLTGRVALPNVKLPDDLSAALREYQKVGVEWLSFLRSCGVGALLADDMGLGKTLQALCVVSGRTLIVAPTSVIHGWEEQIRRFRPGLTVCRYHGARRKLDALADITITTYALLRLDIETLSEVRWSTLVLDESQTIKNADSQVAQAAYRLNAEWKLNLSGTPVENSLEDLWSQSSFLNPGLLGSRSEFERYYIEPILAGDSIAAQRLKRRVGTFTLRRLKRDVATELPPKTEVTIECELSSDERLVYDTILGSSRESVVTALEEKRGLFSVLEVLLRLRQACCHVGLIPGCDLSRSSKVDLLGECLARSKASGHRCLVFSQWTSLLDRVEPVLTELGISWDRIDGSTSDRGEVVSRFQREDGADVLLLSLKAGGVGLNLTAADHVYILDPWWNPAVEDQAADRTYRIGQKNPVIVHRLVARDTIEERVLALQAHKRSLLGAATGDGAVERVTPEEILTLLNGGDV